MIHADTLDTFKALVTRNVDNIAIALWLTEDSKQSSQDTHIKSVTVSIILSAKLPEVLQYVCRVVEVPLHNLPSASTFVRNTYNTIHDKVSEVTGIHEKPIPVLEGVRYTTFQEPGYIYPTYAIKEVVEEQEETVETE
jgi:hypothetical protein